MVLRRSGGFARPFPMNRSSLPTHANADLIEATYQAWLNDHNSVDPTWRAFFQGFSLGASGGSPVDALAAASGSERDAEVAAPIIDSLKQSRVHHLINTYRSIGHLEAHLDPLSPPPPAHPKLSLVQFSLGEDDLDTTFDIGTYVGGGQMKLRDIVANLRRSPGTHRDRVPRAQGSRSSSISVQARRSAGHRRSGGHAPWRARLRLP